MVPQNPNPNPQNQTVALKDTVRTATEAADAKFSAAINPTRDLSFFTLSAFVPIAIISGALLLHLKNRWVMSIVTGVCVLISLAGFGRLMYETTLDIAGYPDFRMPVWVVFYLVVYLISGFTFLFFWSGHKFSQKALMNAFYASLSGYIGNPVEHPTLRFFAILQTFLSSFIHVVIITKFVNAF